MKWITIGLAVIIGVPIICFAYSFLRDLSYLMGRRAKVDYPFVDRWPVLARKALAALLCGCEMCIWAGYVAVALAIGGIVGPVAPAALLLTGYGLAFITYFCLRLYWHRWRNFDSTPPHR